MQVRLTSVRYAGIPAGMFDSSAVMFDFSECPQKGRDTSSWHLLCVRLWLQSAPSMLHFFCFVFQLFLITPSEEDTVFTLILQRRKLRMY